MTMEKKPYFFRNLKVVDLPDLPVAEKTRPSCRLKGRPEPQDVLGQPGQLYRSTFDRGSQWQAAGIGMLTTLKPRELWTVSFEVSLGFDAVNDSAIFISASIRRAYHQSFSPILNTPHKPWFSRGFAMGFKHFLRIKNPMGVINGGFHRHGGSPMPIAGWFLLGKIPSFEMDEKWGYTMETPMSCQQHICYFQASHQSRHSSAGRHPRHVPMVSTNGSEGRPVGSMGKAWKS